MVTIKCVICTLAYEYEKLQSDGEFLAEFFASSMENIKTEIVRRWLKQLIDCRSSGKQFHLPSDSNLNTMLKHILHNEQGQCVVTEQAKSKSSTAVDRTELLASLVKGMKLQQH